MHYSRHGGHGQMPAETLKVSSRMSIAYEEHVSPGQEFIPLLELHPGIVANALERQRRRHAGRATVDLLASVELSPRAPLDPRDSMRGGGSARPPSSAQCLRLLISPPSQDPKAGEIQSAA